MVCSVANGLPDTKPLDLSPLPSDMRNATFVADATAGFDETPARGPYTLAMANSAIYPSLAQMDSGYMKIVNNIRKSIADGSAVASLPADYRSNPAMVAGYKQQLSVLADYYANSKAPSTEVPWATGNSARLFLLHPLSRGTVRLNTTHPLEQPILDYRTGSNAIDFDIHVSHLRYLRKMINTTAMQRYGTVEVSPGPALQSDAELINHTQDTMVFSFMHPCCTATMMPKDKGGVVGPDLKVYGAAGLRIADISVVPLLPSSHTSQLAYAIGEKVRWAH